MERGDFNPRLENGPRVPATPYVAVLPYRFTFRALDPLFFPAGEAANTLRGALGMGLRRVSCPVECSSPAPTAIARTPGSFRLVIMLDRAGSRILRAHS